MQIKDLLNYAATTLKSNNIPKPELDARIILSFAISKEIEYIIAHDYEIVPQKYIEIFDSYLKRRLNFEPVAYITSCKEFYGYNFFVNNSVLIPRADTELLVESVVREQKTNKANLKILELGVGSGCIGITLLKILENADLTGTDISQEALSIASYNSKYHGVEERISLKSSNWFDDLEKQEYDVIISNPPYISKAEIDHVSRETLLYEPHLALFAQDNGLAAYEAISSGAKDFMKHNSKIFLEIGFAQKQIVTKLFESSGYKLAATHNDLGGNSRVLCFNK